MKILIVEDDKNFRKILAADLIEEGHAIHETDSGVRGLEIMESDEYDVLLLDLNIPDMNGLEILKKIKDREIRTEVIIMTGDTTVLTAVKAMQLGAYDYLTKPFKLEELEAVIEKAYEKKKLRGENLFLKTQLQRQSGSKKIITKNLLLLDILETAKKVAMSDFPILISGESGVGKELVAWGIHEASPRNQGPFVAINCGALPESMLENELFGHEKGAFTSAHERKLGLIEVANNGTVFLDEIGELPLQLQVKLLRVIETKVFFRVGGTREIRMNVKFVSATNKDLEREIEKGSFRADLYYRISALTLRIPPLRERKDDIPLLVEHFQMENPVFRKKQFSKEAMKALAEYSWPGNVRELQNLVHRTLLLSKNDIIEYIDLPSDLIASGKNPGRRLEDIERGHILEVLREVDGQKGKAAEILGIDPKTLYRKLLGYGIKE